MGKKSDSRNAMRDLRRALGWPDKAPEIKWIEIPTADGPATPHPIFCPIETFEKVAADPKHFKESILGPDGEIKKYWDGLRGTVLHKPNGIELDHAHTVAGSIHGDGAPTNQVQSLFTISWSSNTVRMSTQLSKFIFSVVGKSDIVDGTLEALFDYFAWAMNVLLEGKWPERDWRGKPMKNAGQPLKTNGWKFCIDKVKGDWEFYTDVHVLDFPRWDSEPNMCFVCNASNSLDDLLWTNGTLGAGWRCTIRTHASYTAERLATGRPLPNLFKIRTLVLEGIMIDVLHAVDQGVSSHVAANVFVEVMDLGVFGATNAEAVAGLEEDLQSWYDANKGVYKIQGELNFSRIKTSGDWPKLKAKAAATRHIIRYAVVLATRHNSGTTHDKRRLAICTLLQRFYAILENEGRYVSDAAKIELPKLAQTLIQLYHLLSKEALGMRLRRWKMPQKFHMFQHLCEIQIVLFGNARFYWTYTDEDLMKMMKEIALTAHPSNVAWMTLYKWGILKFDRDLIVVCGCKVSTKKKLLKGSALARRPLTPREERERGEIEREREVEREGKRELENERER
jgi:hypothetical protein